MSILKMKAAILETLNAPLFLDELQVPSLDCGQVLVQVYRSGICGAQLAEIAGSRGEDKYLPHLLGHEGGGIVAEIGPGVTHVKPGDHVVMHWRKGIGIESKPPTYKRGQGIVGAGWITTFNQYAIVSENRLTRVSKDIPFEIAALMGCAVTTALGLINNEAQLKIGQSVAVFGCGGVGLNVVQGAAMASAEPIIAIDIYDNKLNMAATFGATHVINASRIDVSEEIQKLIGRKGVDVFVETTGLARSIQQAYELTSATGRTIVVGTPHFEQEITVRSLSLHAGKLLIVSDGGQTNPTTDIPKYLNLYSKGRLRLDKLITHRFALDDINIALEKIRNGEAGRCILTIA